MITRQNTRVYKTLAQLAAAETAERIINALDRLEKLGHDRSHMEPIVRYYFMKHLERALQS